MRLSMLLTTSYNLSLSYCQLVVDPLCLGFLFCLPFVSMVINLFFRDICTILQLKFLLVKVPCDWSKIDSRFPFSISFTQSKVLRGTIYLGKLFSWRHLSNCRAILMCKLLKFLNQYPCTSSGTGNPSTCFLTFLISLCMPSRTVSSSNLFSAFINKSVFSLCFTAWSHISLQKRLLSSASGIALYLYVSSIS